MFKRRAIISVWDKSGIVELATALSGAGYEILSTSKTAQALRDSGIPVVEISAYTGSPEILGGRVKTLHPKIAGGILTTRKDDTVPPIDVVVCNLYPFSAGLERGATRAELIELIDIGGITLLRAAAKNHAYVAIVSDPGQYAEFTAELKGAGTVGDALRLRLAADAFGITTRYDAAIAAWFAGQVDR
jgi:phosphoribosylaminoimidazolecarboxamide formyltransferase / IMP cyclohydrolase